MNAMSGGSRVRISGSGVIWSAVTRHRFAFGWAQSADKSAHSKLRHHSKLCALFSIPARFSRAPV